MIDKVQKPSYSEECINYKHSPFPYFTIPFVISFFLHPSIFLSLLFSDTQCIFFSYCKISSFTPVPNNMQDAGFEFLAVAILLGRGATIVT
jgi:hypothetical protein